MQTLMQDHTNTIARHNAFVVSRSEKLPVAASIAIPTGYAPYRGSLTPREAEILELLGKGLSMKGAARGLGISAGTVKWHMKNAYQKLGAGSREDALTKARQWQLII